MNDSISTLAAFLALAAAAGFRLMAENALASDRFELNDACKQFEDDCLDEWESRFPKVESALYSVAHGGEDHQWDCFASQDPEGDIIEALDDFAEYGDHPDYH